MSTVVSVWLFSKFFFVSSFHFISLWFSFLFFFLIFHFVFVRFVETLIRSVFAHDIHMSSIHTTEEKMELCDQKNKAKTESFDKWKKKEHSFSASINLFSFYSSFLCPKSYSLWEWMNDFRFRIDKLILSVNEWKIESRNKTKKKLFSVIRTKKWSTVGWLNE